MLYFGSKLSTNNFRGQMEKNSSRVSNHIVPTEPRILLYDLETSLEAVTVFQLRFNDFIPPESIVTERHIISVSYKWLDEDKVHSISILDDPKRFSKDIHDDRYVVEKFVKVMAEADVVVGHNSDNFDNRYLKTRILYHGLPALPPITSIDTCKVAKSALLFNSCKLDYIGGYLKVGRKKPVTSGLWMRAFKGDKKAILEMVAYNKQDVLLLERVFLKLRPYISNHINRELWGNVGCPKCGSRKVQSRGVYRAISRVYQRYQCQSCSGWFRSAKNDRSIKTKFRVL